MAACVSIPVQIQLRTEDGGQATTDRRRPHAAAAAARAAAAAAAQEWIVVVYHSRNDRSAFVALSPTPARPLSISTSYTHSTAAPRWRAAAAAAATAAQPPRRSFVSHPTRRITPLPSLLSSFLPLFGHVCVDVAREGERERASVVSGETGDNFGAEKDVFSLLLLSPIFSRSSSPPPPSLRRRTAAAQQRGREERGGCCSLSHSSHSPRCGGGCAAASKSECERAKLGSRL